MERLKKKLITSDTKISWWTHTYMVLSSGRPYIR
jgi:hypothetical protein